MVRPVEVRPLPEYRIWIEYDDGESGEIDLYHLSVKGAFKAWEEPGYFDGVRIDQYGAIAWNDDIDMCRYALYLELTGKSWEDLPDEPEAAIGDA